MQKAALSLVAGTLVAWLKDRLPSSGKPAAVALAAECEVLIEGLPDEVEVAAVLDVPGVMTCVEWLLTSLGKGHPGDHWLQLATHTLRLYALEHASEIAAGVVAPKTMEHPSAETIRQ